VLYSPALHETCVMPFKVKPEFTLAATVTVSVAVFVESPAAVAVTVTLPVEAGNVKSPVLSMDPAEVRHLTVELKAPLPVTVAVH